MGLDNFASRTPGEVTLNAEDEAAFAAAGLDLCGGMHSDGVTSIRGKVYFDLVLEVTGESLLTEWLPPARVRAIAAGLIAHPAAALAEINDQVRPRLKAPPTSPAEMAHLQRFFSLCAELELGLIGWW